MSDIRRFGPGGNRNTDEVAEIENMPAKWRRSQDHFSAYTRLNNWELVDELEEVNERWKNWKKSRLIDSGLAFCFSAAASISAVTLPSKAADNGTGGALGGTTAIAVAMTTAKIVAPCLFCSRAKGAAGGFSLSPTLPPSVAAKQ